MYGVFLSSQRPAPSGGSPPRDNIPPPPPPPPRPPSRLLRPTPIPAAAATTATATPPSCFHPPTPAASSANGRRAPREPRRGKRGEKRMGPAPPALASVAAATVAAAAAAGPTAIPPPPAAAIRATPPRTFKGTPWRAGGSRTRPHGGGGTPKPRGPPPLHPSWRRPDERRGATAHWLPPWRATRAPQPPSTTTRRAVRWGYHPPQRPPRRARPTMAHDTAFFSYAHH